MPYPDYDGISDLYLTEIERGEREMLAYLTEAQRDGELPAFTVLYVWAICGSCRGEGGHSRRLGVISAETWNDWEDEDRAFYMGGGYNITCEGCGGSGKVREIDTEAMPEVAQKWVRDYMEAVYDSAETSRAERLFGC